MQLSNNVSSNFVWNKYDATIAVKILKHEGTPQAVRIFSKYQNKLSNYAYWFFLSTCWVSYSGKSDLNLWKSLFSSQRANRETSIMKPNELAHFRALPDILTIYRAHGDGETDWIAYTLCDTNAYFFAKQKGAPTIKKYQVKRSDVLCLFLRRGEFEILILDKNKPVFISELEVDTLREIYHE